ncbi:MAG: hypothetical protein ACJA2S_004485 [Cyclobacteriaceae bacterium]|jgi:hypothetical protein
MLGIPHKISDHSLYLLNDMIENQVANAKAELESIDPENIGRIEFLQNQIDYYESVLEKFKSDIKQQLKEKFQFSREELYSMYGQYDKYISIEFHKFSKSAENFGGNISGVIQYYKGEREHLEIIIKEESVPRTNDFVKIDCSADENLNDKQKKELAEDGFLSGDVYQILASDLPAISNYNKPGIKEIPNTINIEFDPTDFDPFQTSLWIFSKRLKNGGQLIDIEWAKFCGYLFHYEKETLELKIIQDRLFDDKGKVKIDVRYYEFQAKLFNGDIEKDEILEFIDLLKNRRFERTAEIEKEIKRSTNKSLDAIKDEFPDIYQGLQKSIKEFDAESLAYHNLSTPIYWDYESFLHIYLRHCDDLAIEGHFANKTKFQYTQKDIKRILEIAIEKLLPQIDERLKAGKEFRNYGDRSLYFNGNHYALHILSDGRVAAFHPIENPKE